MSWRPPIPWLCIAALLLCSLPCGAEPTTTTIDTVQRTLLRRTSRRFLVCGHRGAFFHKPNNSPKSIENALRNGADLIEIDIETTSDRHCVVAHDPWPRKKTLATWRMEGKGLITMYDALRQIGRRAVTVLDIKTTDLDAVCREVKRLKVEDHTVLYSLDYPRLRKHHATAYVMVRARNAAQVHGFAKSPDKNIVIIHGDYSWLTPSLIRTIRGSNRRVFVNSYKLDPLEERLGAGTSVARCFRRGIGIAQTNHVRSAVATRRRFARGGR